MQLHVILVMCGAFSTTSKHAYRDELGNILQSQGGYSIFCGIHVRSDDFIIIIIIWGGGVDIMTWSQHDDMNASCCDSTNANSVNLVDVIVAYKV